jgi:hypothetical protein
MLYIWISAENYPCLLLLLWHCSPLLDLSRFFIFFILYIVGSTPWTGVQPVARPLPTRRTTQTQNKRAQIYIYASSGIRTHDPSVRASEGGSCLIDGEATVIYYSSCISVGVVIGSQNLTFLVSFCWKVVNSRQHFCVTGVVSSAYTVNSRDLFDNSPYCSWIMFPALRPTAFPTSHNKNMSPQK